MHFSTTNWKIQKNEIHKRQILHKLIIHFSWKFWVEILTRNRRPGVVPPKSTFFVFWPFLVETKKTPKVTTGQNFKTEFMVIFPNQNVEKMTWKNCLQKCPHNPGLGWTGPIFWWYIFLNWNLKHFQISFYLEAPPLRVPRGPALAQAAGKKRRVRTGWFATKNKLKKRPMQWPRKTAKQWTLSSHLSTQTKTCSFFRNLKKSMNTFLLSFSTFCTHFLGFYSIFRDLLRML